MTVPNNLFMQVCKICVFCMSIMDNMDTLLSMMDKRSAQIFILPVCKWCLKPTVIGEIPYNNVIRYERIYVTPVF